MAGIISNVDSDVQKLRKLKNEIESVKKALKGINVTVDIDIAENLQSKLASLMGQYDALVDKVSVAEGKIMLSVSRINKATESIIQANERIAQSAGIPVQDGNGITQANTTETASVQAQAKAYEDLRIEINDILGTRDANVKRMVEEMNAIRLINAELKKITKQQGESSSLSSDQKKRIEQLNNSLLTHKAALSEVRQTLSNNAKLDNAASTSMKGLSQSLSRMRIAYRELTEEERNSPFGKELLASIQQADAKIKELDATIGNHQRNVGNYASGWNGLSMSIQQIGRELPSLAYGPKVFFSAISNNLPILADEIKRAITEYELLKKSGQSAVPVWKQVVSSLISWQTALTVGITLLTLYGDKIVDWASGLFKAKKALADTYQATEEFQDSVSKSTGKILTTIEKLSRAWIKLGDDIKSKEKFILDYKSELDSTGIAINNVADAENFLSKNKDSFINAIIAKAKATAIMELASKEYEKYIQKMLEADAKAEKGVSFGDRAKSWFVRSFAQEGSSGTLQNSDLTPEAFAKERESQLREDAESHKTSMLNLIKKALGIDEESNKEIERAGGKSKDILVANSVESIEAAISAKREELKKATNRKDYLKIETEIKAEQTKLEAITGNAKQENQAKKDAEVQLKQQEQLSEQLLSLRRKNRQDEINLMEEGTEKKLAQIKADFESQKQTIEKQAKELAKTNKEAGVANLNKNGLTQEQQEEINKAVALNVQSMNKSITDLYKSPIEQYRSYTDERLSIEKKFNDDIALLQEARRKAEEKGDANEIAKIDRSIAKATAEKGKRLMKHDFDVLKQSPEYIRAFEDLKNTSSETLNSLLNQLENAKQTAAETLNPEDLREYTTTIQEIMDELDARNPFQALADRQKELAEAEKELAEAKRQLDAVNRGERIVTGVKTSLGEDGKIKIENTYLSAADALNKYNAAKDKHQKANNNFIKAEKTAREKVDELSVAIKGVGDAIGGQAGEIISLIGDVASFATGTIDGITKVTQTGANAISAVEKASVILGIISTAIQLLQKIGELGSNKAFKQYEAYAENVKEINALTDAVNEYRIAALEAQQAESNWFSTDNLKNLRDYKALHDEVAKAYADKAMEAQAIYQNKSGGGWLTGAFNWVMGNMSLLSWSDKWKDIWGQGDYEKEMTAAVNNLRIETRKKSSGFLGTGIGGKSQKTEDLITWARNQGLGELFDDEGMINKELAQSIIDSYGNKLVGQTKETLEALIELREQYDEYLNQLHEYVSSLYAPLVDNFVDSLWDWLDNGKDALDSFKDYASSTFRDIVSDMMRTIVLDKVVGTFSDDIAALYEEYAKGAIDETELMKKISERTSGLIDNYEQNIPTLQNIMNEINGYLQGAGIDLKKPESTSQQKATAGGFETMSQDTATELNGRFTALQIAGEEIKSQNAIQSQSMNLLTMKADSLLSIGSETRNIADETRDIMARSYLELVQISENTGNSAKYLKDIKADIAEVKKNTSKL